MDEIERYFADDPQTLQFFRLAKKQEARMIEVLAALGERHDQPATRAELIEVTKLLLMMQNTHFMTLLNAICRKDR